MKANIRNHALLMLGICAAHSASAATLAVTSTADDWSPGTLRAALSSASNGDTIDLTGISGAIALDYGQLVVASDVTIAGPGPSQLAVDAQQNSRVFMILPGATVTISGLAITNGYEDSFLSGISAGGGILNELGTLTVINCDVSGNWADLGAGIFNDGGTLFFGQFSGTATLNLIGSTVSGNVAEFGIGGGLLNGAFAGSFAGVNIQSSTLSGNSAQLGGAILNGDGGTLTLNSSTLSENLAFSGTGGGVAIRESSVSIRNTILDAGSQGANLWVDPAYASTVQSYGYNLCSDDGAGYLIAAGDQINTDPTLGPLQDNDGPTRTHALLPGSPAIDTGASTDIAGFPVTVDQRGLTRPQGIAVDIGAFEVEQDTPPPSHHQYSWSGVLRPLNADGSSVFKAGSTVPVKFMLTGDDADITDLIATLSYARINNGVVGTVNEANTKASADSGNQFRYDSTGAQYIYNWSTKGLSAGGYRLFLNLGDGVERTVDVGLK